MKPALIITAFSLLTGCADNSCIDLCKQYELYLDDCGYGWSTVFEDEGWITLDDCYNDHWEADANKKIECESEIPEIQTLECF